MIRATLLFVLAIAAGGCNWAVCGGSEVKAATTAAQEEAALEHVWKDCRPLSVSAFASDGSQVSFSDPALTKKIHRIHVSASGRSFEHTLIAPDNVLLLLRE